MLLWNFYSNDAVVRRTAINTKFTLMFCLFIGSFVWKLFCILCSMGNMFANNNQLIFFFYINFPSFSLHFSFIRSLYACAPFFRLLANGLLGSIGFLLFYFLFTFVISLLLSFNAFSNECFFAFRFELCVVAYRLLYRFYVLRVFVSVCV